MAVVRLGLAHRRGCYAVDVAGAKVQALAVTTTLLLDPDGAFSVEGLIGGLLARPHDDKRYLLGTTASAQVNSGSKLSLNFWAMQLAASVLQMMLGR